MYVYLKIKKIIFSPPSFLKRAEQPKNQSIGRPIPPPQSTWALSVSLPASHGHTLTRPNQARLEEILPAGRQPVVKIAQEMT